MLRSLNQMVSSSTQNFAMFMLLAVFGLFMGITISGKFDTKWGYVLSAIAVVFGLFVLKANRVF